MKPNEMILEHIRRHIDFYEIMPIEKGYSADLKYILITKTGEKYLARITKSDDIREMKLRRAQFDLMKDLSHYSSLVPQAYHFWLSDYARLCVMIIGYVDGEDGEESLNRLVDEIQYEIGYQAGEELKKLHQLIAPPETPPWHQVQQRKYEWYYQEFTRNPLKPEGVDMGFIEAFIKKHQYLMEETRSTFQHDDYHPANLIIQNGHLSGIIDFNRCDWGDPIHDFYKVAYFTRNISIPFACGQIDGYHQGTVSSDFWKRYALYSAMRIIPDMVWSGRYARRTGSHQELEKSIQRIKVMYDDHNGFSSVIPRWYTERFYR